LDIALTILLVAGPLGATDVIYFHLWKFRLYERRESVKEETTHIIRGIMVPSLTGILLLGYPEGLWFWVVAALFAFDALNTLLDVIFEPASRAPRIVPQTELAVHFLGTSLMGAAWAVFMVAGWGARLNSTAIRPRGRASFIPDWALGLGYVALAGAFALVLFEATLFVRAILRRRMLALTHS
jgi:hypothetical protein